MSEDVTEKIKSLLQDAVGRKADERKKIFQSVADIFPTELLPQLDQLLSAPTWITQLISPVHTATLIDMGLVVFICKNNKRGYYAALSAACSVKELIPTTPEQ